MSRLNNKVTIAGREIAVPVTLTDQLINYFSPTAGAARYQARLRMAITGGYSGADRTRRANQLGRSPEMSADAATLPDLSTLRADAQHLFRNNCIAGGAIRTNVTKVVGSGLKVKSQIDRDVLQLTPEAADAWERSAEREFKLATETREIDVERQLPFSLMQGLAFLSVLDGGDVLVNMPRFTRPGSPYKLKLQLIEAARICNKDNKPDTTALAGGVKRDAKTGAPIGYQVLNQHPGSRLANKNKFTWTELAAFSKSGQPLALHLFDKMRPNQSRGVPYLAPVVETIKQLGRYTDAEVMAAVVTGMLTVFVTNEAGQAGFGPAPSAENPDGEASAQADTTGLELGYGSVVGLLPGEKIETVNPNRPNTAFDPFFVAITRQIGMALELPVEVLFKQFVSSYSAARGALEEAWDYFMRRRHWLVTMLCQPVYEAVITEAVAQGRLSAPGFFSDPLIRAAWCSSTWLGEAANQIDPLKEINAAAKRVELSITTLDEESRKLTGTPWEDKLPQLIKERQILRAAGIDEPIAETLAQGEPEENENAPAQGDRIEDVTLLRNKMDTYGIGVRAGTLTPQVDDENHFRAQLGLPAASNPITEAWDNDGGTRRPVTLASGKEAEAAADAADDATEPDPDTPQNDEE